MQPRIRHTGRQIGHDNKMWYVIGKVLDATGTCNRSTSPKQGVKESLWRKGHLIQTRKLGGISQMKCGQERSREGTPRGTSHQTERWEMQFELWAEPTDWCFVTSVLEHGLHPKETIHVFDSGVCSRKWHGQNALQDCGDSRRARAEAGRPLGVAAVVPGKGDGLQPRWGRGWGVVVEKSE